MPILDLRDFLTQVLFNYLIGNCDAHSKNYSILYDEKGKARLAPIYDCVSTIEYPDLTRKLSMKIGSHYEIDKICDDDFNFLSEQLNINPKTISGIRKELERKLYKKD